MLISHPFSDFIELLRAMPAASQAPYGVVRLTTLEGGAVVIGGGIRAVRTAWFLIRCGASVARYVKAKIGCELSRRAFDHSFSWDQALAQVGADLIAVSVPVISQHPFAPAWCSDGNPVAAVR
ncbi:hypothetical protein [Paraburkholderia acidiphila]|uniref:hypothetical protein n=1 Tax=Paraburkholderia acidiphila TaxID=2571747 RepID=UPI00131DA12B|nr:hypothetical protein [Paraburkholderia acidiphila]